MGDLARYLPEAKGFLEFIGRVDNQVKIRGYRIELEEIEKIIKKVKYIKDAVVIVRGGNADNKELVAYIIRKEDEQYSEDDIIYSIRQKIKEILPEYMMPKAFVFIEQFPLNSSGKIDRRKLPDPGIKDYSNQTVYVEPQNQTEEMLVRIWEELLHIHPIGINHNFFDIGGNSLMIVTMMSEIVDQFDQELALSDIFQSPTIAQLANLLSQRKHISAVFSPLVKIQASEDKVPLIFVHPGDGNLFCYKDLFWCFDPTQPIYGLQAFGTTSDTSPLSKIEDMATEYIKAIHPLLSRDGFVLAGFCGSGGTIAYEMAQQIQYQGVKAPPIILIDSIEPSYFKMIEINDVTIFMDFLRDLGGLSNIDLVPLFNKKMKIKDEACLELTRHCIQGMSHQERLDVLWECAKSAKIASTSSNIDYLYRIYDVYIYQVQALKNYQTKPYSGRIHLLRASMKNPDSSIVEEEFSVDRKWMSEQQIVTYVNRIVDKPYYGWEDYNDSIKAFDIPGTHFTMLRRPNVDFLAYCIKNCIQNLSN
ncbi:MAG: hypothetical protein KJ737_27320 [Proteobacteria bacterium]|nr:hypothetical protein [Pseudomonadota bacterium]